MSLNLRFYARPHPLTWRMHYKPLKSQDGRSRFSTFKYFFLSNIFFVIAIVFVVLFFFCFAWCTQKKKEKRKVWVGGVSSISPLQSVLLPNPLHRPSGESASLLQDGRDGGATAAQRSGSLIAFKGRASNGCEPQRRARHSWYVTETARFLVARCLRGPM